MNLIASSLVGLICLFLVDLRSLFVSSTKDFCCVVYHCIKFLRSLFPFKNINGHKAHQSFWGKIIWWACTRGIYPRNDLVIKRKKNWCICMYN